MEPSAAAAAANTKKIYETVMNEAANVSLQLVSLIIDLSCMNGKTAKPSGHRLSPHSSHTISSTECVPAASRTSFMMLFSAE